MSGSVSPDGAEKALSHTAAINVDEKSDTLVSKKPPNKGKPAEVVERRRVAKRNVRQTLACRTQSRESASMRLEDVRQMARKDKRVRFTALLHHVTPELLIDSFYELNKSAATGVDGVTWTEYEKQLMDRIPILHEEIHTGR